jgi:hypothetical protein
MWSECAWENRESHRARRVCTGSRAGSRPAKATHRDGEVDVMSEEQGSSVPPGTDTGEVAPNPAGIVQPEPPEGGPEADENSPDPADLAPGFGGTSETRPESQED